jgi:membrane protease YdiL (CAAX protease family)
MLSPPLNQWLRPADDASAGRLHRPRATGFDPPVPDIPEIPNEATPPPGRISALLGISVAGVGLLAFYLDVKASGIGKGAYDLPFRVGSVIGAMVVWPLIIVGLFSIGRQFRNDRARAIILLVMWSLVGLGSLGNISKARQDAKAAPVGSQYLPTPPTPDYTTPLKYSLLGGVVKNPSQATPAQAAPTPAQVEPKPTQAEPAPAQAAPAPPQTDYDFSAGSDKRLIDLIEHAQEGQYHAIVAGYAKACEARGGDPVLALERVQFIERFSGADDFPIKSAQDDLAVAVEYLNSHFPDSPGTVLHKLRNFRAAGFEASASHYSPMVSDWPAADRARFLLLRAQAANLKSDRARVESLCSASFECAETAEAGLLLAQTLNAEGKKQEAVGILGRIAFDKAKPWQTVQGMNLFFDLNERQRAMALYGGLKASAPEYVGNSETAMRIAKAGQVQEARSVLGKIKVAEWNRAKVNRDRFKFEMDYGTAEQARDAYRAMRADGIAADPALSGRLALFARHPALGWNLDDLSGLFVLGALLVGAYMLPLLLLAPVHYWSLLRPRRAEAGDWPATAWGLRHAWLALGVLMLADMVGLLWFRPDMVRSWWTRTVHEPAVTPEALLSEQMLAWAALSGVLAFLLWRARAWRSLGPGQWGTWKAVGLGLGVGFALRVGLGIYVLIWPQAKAGSIASIQALANQLYSALLDKYGALGLIAAVAVLVPVLEEVLFRGVLLQAVSRCIPFGWANAGQALAFALVHGSLWLLPFYFAVGVAGGVLARRSGGLLPSIMMHSCNNLFACVAVISMQHHPQ